MNLSTNVKTTMSSLEIAELTGKGHNNVLRDIRVTMAQLAELIGLETTDYTSNDLSYLTNQGVTIEYCPQTKRASSYNLPKLVCDLVITAYSVKYRYAIIKRWHELEEKIKKPDMISGFNNWNALKVEVPIPLKKLDMAALEDETNTLNVAGFNKSVIDMTMLGQTLGMTNNESILTADNLWLKEHGYSAIDLLGIRGRFQIESLRNGLIELKTPVVEIKLPHISTRVRNVTETGRGNLVTASDIGRRLILEGVKRRKLSGRNINELLLEMGLLKGKPQQWLLTDKGEKYGSYVGYQGETYHQSIRWYAEPTFRAIRAYLTPLTVVVASK